MTLPLNSRLSALYDTNGTQKDFSFGFRVFFDPDNGGYGLEVRRQTADGYEVIPKSDYLVLPVEDNSAGVVRFSVAPSAGQQIYIAGKTPTIQQLVLTNFGRYSAESIETQFDFITAIIQEWLSALGEETRQRMAADDILTQYVVQRIDDFVQQVNQNFDDKSQEIEDYIATIMPSFTQTLRDEIEAFAVAGMQDAIDQTLADSKAEIDDAVARANAAALAAAITGKVYDTPNAGVDPVTGVANGAYFNVRSSNDESYIDEYQNVGGTAVATGKRYPSGGYVETIAEYTAMPLKVGKSYALHERVQLANGDIVKSTIDGNTNNPNANMTGWLNAGNIGEVESITDLLAIQNPKDGQAVSAKGLQGGTFIFDSAKSNINDGIVVFNGHVRQITGVVTPFMAGAKAQTGIDDSAAINTALAYARTNGLKCWGVGKTFECRDLLIDDDLIFVDANLVCNKFDQDLVSVMSTAISSVPLTNVYFSKIKINGKRELHTGIKGTTTAEDGGRHAFRFRRPIDGLYMEQCAGNNSAGDGIEFFPTGSGLGLLKNIKIVDCEFNWNRRHGGSGDKTDGIDFVRTKFLYNNLDLPSATGSPNNTLGLFADRNVDNTHQYGAGFDLEEYGTSDISQRVRFIDCEMYGNAYASLTLYRPTGWSNFTGDNDIIINGGTYGPGLNGLISIEVSPFAPFGGGFNKAFNGVKIDNVNCLGGAIYTRYSDVSVSRLSNVSEIRVHGQGVLRADKEYLFNNSVSTIYVGSMIAETTTMDAALKPYRYTLSGSALKIPEVSGQTSKLQIQGSSVRVEHIVGGDSLRGYFSMNLNSTWGGTDFTMYNQLEGKGLYFNLHDMFICPSVNAGASLGIADLRFSTAFLTTSPNVSSDKRYKEEIKSLTQSEKEVAADLKKNIKTYLLIGGDDQIHIGMIAQEVVEIFERHGLDAHKYKLIHVDDDGMYSIVYEQLILFMLSVN